jgi:hypothetical protein
LCPDTCILTLDTIFQYINIKFKIKWKL